MSPLFLWLPLLAAGVLAQFRVASSSGRATLQLVAAAAAMLVALGLTIGM